MSSHTRNTKGFTLIEVLIVVVLISVLTSIGILSYRSFQQDTRAKKREADMTVLMNGLETYYQKNGDYPTDAHWGSMNLGADVARSSGPLLGRSLTNAQLKAIIPALPTEFGDPLRESADALLANTDVTRTGDNIRYFYIGGMNFINATSRSGTANFATKSGSFQCAYTMTGAANSTMSFILGYYNEQDDTYTFKRGLGGTQITWNTANQPLCAKIS